MRRAARVDNNQAEIVAALKKIGCDVEIIGRPVDLLVGYRAVNLLLEVKQKGSENRKDQQAQRDWIAAWRGQVRVVRTPQEAIDLVSAAYRNVRLPGSD